MDEKFIRKKRERITRSNKIEATNVLYRLEKWKDANKPEHLIFGKDNTSPYLGQYCGLLAGRIEGKMNNEGIKVITPKVFFDEAIGLINDLRASLKEDGRRTLNSLGISHKHSTDEMALNLITGYIPRIATHVGGPAFGYKVERVQVEIEG